MASRDRGARRMLACRTASLAEASVDVAEDRIGLVDTVLPGSAIRRATAQGSALRRAVGRSQARDGTHFLAEAAGAEREHAASLSRAALLRRCTELREFHGDAVVAHDELSARAADRCTGRAAGRVRARGRRGLREQRDAALCCSNVADLGGRGAVDLAGPPRTGRALQRLRIERGRALDTSCARIRRGAVLGRFARESAEVGREQTAGSSARQYCQRPRSSDATTPVRATPLGTRTSTFDNHRPIYAVKWTKRNRSVAPVTALLDDGGPGFLRRRQGSVAGRTRSSLALELVLLLVDGHTLTRRGLVEIE